VGDLCILARSGCSDPLQLIKSHMEALKLIARQRSQTGLA
jgi:hypothetical protein